MKNIFLAAAIFVFCSAAAQAAPCQLTQAASLDMKSDDNGHAEIPISIDGTEVDFVVDTGGAVTAITSHAADKLGLPRKPQNHSSETIFGGAPITQYVTASQFFIGNIHGYNVNLAVLPEGVMEKTDGLLGTTILAAYDVDFDFAKGKFSLFSQQHCYGGVVYWTRQNFAQIPIHYDYSHHIELEAQIDGKPVIAVLDTGAPLSIVSLEFAERNLGVDPKSPDLKAMPETRSGRHYFRYPFKAITLNGLTVSNPDILLVPDGESDTLGTGAGRPSMLLGLSILSKLHLYVAYGEKNLYVTPADAH